MRDAGLVSRLRDGGADVRDHGDRAIWRWRPDRARPRAQNLPAIVEIVRDTARRVGEAIAAGQQTMAAVAGALTGP